MGFLDNLINYLQSAITLFSIPYFYLEARQSSYDKLKAIIDELSNVFLNRIATNNLVTKHELDSLIASYTLNNKVSSSSIKADDVVDKMMSIIETNHFITKNQRRKIIEKILTLRTKERSKKIRYYIFLKNNKKQILNGSILSILFLTLLFPSKWQLFQSINEYKGIAYNFGLGIVYALLIFVVISFVVGVTNGRVFEGEPTFNPNTFKYLPEYYDEYLTFKNQNKVLKLDLKDVVYELNEKIVETDSGCLPFGIIKSYKKLRTYKLVFSNNSGLELHISIEKKSLRNGSIDLDQITYTIIYNSIIKSFSFYPNTDDLDGLNLRDDFTVSSTFNNEVVFWAKLNQNEDTIALDFEKRLLAIRLNETNWVLQKNS